MLDDIGIGGQRLEMVNLSAGMGERFAEIARQITEKIRKLGPNPIRNMTRPLSEAAVQISKEQPLQ